MPNGLTRNGAMPNGLTPNGLRHRNLMQQQSGNATSNDLYGAHYADPTHLWAVGVKGTMLFSVDGGAGWRLSDSGVAGPLAAVAFSGAGNGWAVGDDGVIQATTDGGVNWTKADERHTRGSARCLVQQPSAGMGRWVEWHDPGK